MFLKGERLISPSRMLLCCSVSVGQKGTIDSPHMLMEEMSSCGFLMQTHTSRLTCMSGEMLERDRPSRSDSRLEERSAAFGALGVTAGETEESKESKGSRHF